MCKPKVLLEGDGSSVMMEGLTGPVNLPCALQNVGVKSGGGGVVRSQKLMELGLGNQEETCISCNQEKLCR